MLLCLFISLLSYTFIVISINKGGLLSLSLIFQIVPYYVVTKMGHLKGLTGVYMAVLMSGSLRYSPAVFRFINLSLIRIIMQ